MPKSVTLRIGTRASNLALTQSRMIASALQQKYPKLNVELVEIRTTGDQVRDKPLKSFGGAGVFVKELESALRDKRIDIAVHSLKDMPTRQPRGLNIAAVAAREDVRDVAVLANGGRLEDLPPGSVIGTGSMRRRAQLMAKYPQLEFAEIRGNVETRIRKVREGHYAGTILACAGLNRLKLLDEVAMEVLPLAVVLPAPGQGALAIECRSNDTRTQKLVRFLHNRIVADCVEAERLVLAKLGGGCHLPLAALALREEREGKKVMHIEAMLGLPDGSSRVRCEAWGRPREWRKLALQVAKNLMTRGGKEILAALPKQ